MKVRLLLLFILLSGELCAQQNESVAVSFTTEPSAISLYWKDNDGVILRSLQNLKTFVERQGKQLRFGMNAGMYMRDNSPQGLFIENGTQHTKLDTASGSGNFYLKPNGVFYITNDKLAGICKTEDFDPSNIKFATQSGPMLLIDGEIHPAFKKGSANLNIRNGVGILPDGKVIFAMSKSEINFYDFAVYFKNMGCKQALYLDGFVSRMYFPEKDWVQLDGNFGVMIGVMK